MGELEQLFSASFLYQNQHDPKHLPSLSREGYRNHASPASSSGVGSDSNASNDGDFGDGTLKLITQMLMEEDDLGNKPCMYQQGLALQATEKSFYDAVGKEYPDSTFSNQDIQDPLVFNCDGISHSFGFIHDFFGGEEDENEQEKLPKRSREKKSRDLEDGGRCNKQIACFAEESSYYSAIDKILLCPRLNPHLKEILIGFSREERARDKKNSKKREVVDLTTLLSECARAISRADITSVGDLLSEIRKHSSPYEDGIERLAHYFANALEARMARIGPTLYSGFTTKWISAAHIMKGYEAYVKVCPFSWLSNMYANRSIGKLVQDAQRLHIIDFGILYGFQWPCLIQRFSRRPGGPPRIRMTGIDFPQPGLCPAERVEETGRRIATCCERFGVPFEFNAIAKKWETIDLEDLKIESDEVVVVNCLHRLNNMADETVMTNCPRDAVLNLVKKINPDMFIHGVLNGYYNAPFFDTRFREAIFYFSSLFDMFDTIVPRENQGRGIYEKEVWGRAIMNVIACEGTERVERPESYQKWQARTIRAGFRQLPLDKEIMRGLRDTMKLGYHKDFLVDEDGKWMVQGWKGRIMFALSCWKPTE